MGLHERLVVLADLNGSAEAAQLTSGCVLLTDCRNRLRWVEAQVASEHKSELYKDTMEHFGKDFCP